MANSRAPFVLPASADPALWTVADAEKLYNMAGWGLGYFRVNDEGHVTVHPGRRRRAPGSTSTRSPIDLNAQGVGAPAAAALLRHPPARGSRSWPIASSAAIDEFDYEGSYTTVYPIKVNQQRHVVQEIVEFGTPHGVGLECGSQARADGGARPARDRRRT